MSKTVPILTLLITLFLACCTDLVDKELYGTYIRSLDSGLLYSKFIFYPENKYSFYSSSCLSSNKDSGTFIYKKDTIYFTSFDKERDKLIEKTNSKRNRTLTGEKLVFKHNKIIYFITQINPNRNHDNVELLKDNIINRDTLYWNKETEKN